MSRHKLNLIEECKNNRVKTVILAFIRASAIRGRDGGGRLDVVGAGLDPKGTGVDDGAGPPVEGRKLISTRADVGTHHRRHQEVTEEGGAMVVDGDRLGRHDFHLCEHGHGEVRGGRYRCHHHGNGNTVLCCRVFSGWFPKNKVFEKETFQKHTFFAKQ